MTCRTNSQDEKSEPELIANARHGDRDAMAELFRRHYMHDWAVILAGGDATRGDRRPKQFSAFFSGKSLLAHTRDLLRPLFLDENTLFVLNHAHRIYYERELSDVPSNQKLVQPSNRGTAPAIALAVLEIMKRDPHATIALFPSDHHYQESSIFQATVDRALRLAKNYENRVLVIGAPAFYPEVEYRWIELGPRVVESMLNPPQNVSRFRETPSLEDAVALQRTGSLWNTFVTIASGRAFLDLLASTVPRLVCAIGSGFSASALERIYAEIESIDFAKNVLSLASDRLLALHDGPSGSWDFGSREERWR